MSSLIYRLSTLLDAIGHNSILFKPLTCRVTASLAAVCTTSPVFTVPPDIGRCLPLLDMHFGLVASWWFRPASPRQILPAPSCSSLLVSFTGIGGLALLDR